MGFGACDRPRPLVLCHNVNCVSPDTSRDDTIPALEESLALTFDGRPALDGVELDTFWFGAESRCLLAHDLNGDTTTPASHAARVIADYLAAAARASWNGERFYVFIELKPHVGPAFDDAHTPAQRSAHVACALDVMDTIVAGARAGGHRLTVGFTSSAPLLLETLVQPPRWRDAGDDDLEVLLVGDIFLPYSAAVPELTEYHVPLDAMEYHPDFLTEGRYQTYRSLDLELAQWSLTTTPEALDAIRRYSPRWVLTNEALLLRRWIEP